MTGYTDHLEEDGSLHHQTDQGLTDITSHQLCAQQISAPLLCVPGLHATTRPTLPPSADEVPETMAAKFNVSQLITQKRMPSWAP